jgi:hypothetical protein
MRPEHRTKSAPDAMGGAAHQSEAGGMGPRRQELATPAKSASVRPTRGFMVASPEPLRKREGRA